MQLIYNDTAIVVVNKTPGELVQTDKEGNITLPEILRNEGITEKKVYVVHRIDRRASGLVLFAKTKKVADEFSRMFQNQQIQKNYWAIVKNCPPKQDDRLTHYLIKNEKQNKSIAYDAEQKNSKKAELYYRVIAKTDNYYLLEIELFTGRHHQIRAQLAKVGCPIKGDIKYGAERTNKDGGICLHAREMQFEHPFQNKKMHFIADTPDDKLWNDCVALINKI